MVRFWAVLAAGCCLVSLFGCGKRAEGQVSEIAPVVTECVTEIATEAVTEEITECVTEDAVGEVTEGFAEWAEDVKVEYHFRSEKQLQQHFDKHGGEFGEDFGYSSAEEYESGASDVINDPSALFKLEAEDGDGVYYIEESNEFVILSQDGFIRTYFRPSAGKKYFDRQ